MPCECRLHGMDELLERLEQLGQAQVLDASERALAQSLNAIREEAQTLCPKETGALARSLRSQIRREEGGLLGTVASGLPYAAAVEMGSASRAAQPFLYPAYKAGERGAVGGVFSAVLGGVTE